MLAGRLDRRLTLQQATVVTDDMGGEDKTWATLATVWASKHDVSDTERLRAEQVGSSITTRFQARYSSFTSQLRARDRVVCEGRVYDVTGPPKELGRRDGIEITATALAD